MGTGKGGTSASQAPAASQYDFDYLNRYPDVAKNGMNPYYHYLRYGKAEGRTYGPAAPSGDMGFGDAMSGIMESMMMVQQQQQEANARAQALYLKQQEEAQARTDMNSMFSTKLDAANQATATVENDIAQEMAHAKVNSLDYSITPEQKQERINNTFAGLWSEGQDTQLQSLVDKYDKKGEFSWTLPVVRGDNPVTATETPAEGPSAGSKVAKGKKTGTVLTTLPDDITLGSSSKTVLGG